MGDNMNNIILESMDMRKVKYCGILSEFTLPDNHKFCTIALVIKAHKFYQRKILTICIDV